MFQHVYKWDFTKSYHLVDKVLKLLQEGKRVLVHGEGSSDCYEWILDNQGLLTILNHNNPSKVD